VERWRDENPHGIEAADGHLDGGRDGRSSLRAGPGELWEVCEHANYQGRCAVVSEEERDLRRIGWNDIISSARRVGGGGVGIRSA
jgi:hypothetical protein